MRIEGKEELPAICEIMRAKGIRELTVGDVKIVLDPLREPMPPRAQPEADPEMCRCGHSIHQHSSGLCLLDCSVETCAGPEAAA